MVSKKQSYRSQKGKVSPFWDFPESSSYALGSLMDKVFASMLADVGAFMLGFNAVSTIVSVVLRSGGLLQVTPMQALGIFILYVSLLIYYVLTIDYHNFIVGFETR